MVAAGNGISLDPVAMVAFFAFKLNLPPSSSCTKIIFGDAKDALPSPLNYMVGGGVHFRIFH